MLPDRFYCTEIHEGPKSRQFCFYASTEGLTDPQYGYAVSDSWIVEAYESAIEENRKQLQAQHETAKDGVVVTASAPVEVSPEDLVRMNPLLNVYVADAIELAKRELGFALHPIKTTWFWESSADRNSESCVQLRVSDETGVFGRGFTPQELKNHSLVESQISRLYRDLLQLGSRTRVMNLLRMNAGTERE
jgi:hypothetical protein